MILIITAGIIGMLNEYFGWLSFVLHFMYLLQVVIIELVAAVLLRLVKKNEKIKQGFQYFVNYVMDGTPYYYIVLGIVWAVTAVIVILQLYLSLGYKNDIFMIFSLDAGTPAMVLSCVAEVLAAGIITKNMLSRRVKKVEVKESK